MQLLKNALTANAIFSGISGISLIVFSKSFAKLFMVASNTVFWIVGIVLIYFAITIIVEIFKTRSLAILFIIVQDILWVVGSMILVLTNPFSISITGNTIIAIIALIVMLFAILQGLGLSRIDEVDNKTKMKRLSFKKKFNANKADVWEIVSDTGNIDKYASNVDKSQIVSGSGKGMVRSCSHGKKQWTETCSLWDEGNKISYIINTQAPDYPFPLSYLKGTWQVKELSANKTELLMHFDLIFNRNIQRVFLYPLLKTNFNKIANELLENWETAILKLK